MSFNVNFLRETDHDPSISEPIFESRTHPPVRASSADLHGSVARLPTRRHLTTATKWRMFATALEWACSSSSRRCCRAALSSSNDRVANHHAGTASGPTRQAHSQTDDRNLMVHRPTALCSYHPSCPHPQAARAQHQRRGPAATCRRFSSGWRLQCRGNPTVSSDPQVTHK
jgi:hypothetical protein